MKKIYLITIILSILSVAQADWPIEFTVYNDTTHPLYIRGFGNICTDWGGGSSIAYWHQIPPATSRIPYSLTKEIIMLTGQQGIQFCEDRDKRWSIDFELGKQGGGTLAQMRVSFTLPANSVA